MRKLVVVCLATLSLLLPMASQVEAQNVISLRKRPPTRRPVAPVKKKFVRPKGNYFGRTAKQRFNFRPIRHNSYASHR